MEAGRSCSNPLTSPCGFPVVRTFALPPAEVSVNAFFKSLILALHAPKKHTIISVDLRNTLFYVSRQSVISMLRFCWLGMGRGRVQMH